MARKRAVTVAMPPARQAIVSEIYKAKEKLGADPKAPRRGRLMGRHPDR
jgi:hypothetical protein